MSRTYDIKTERFGVVPILADNIDEARKRARRMFHPAAVTVTAHVEYR